MALRDAFYVLVLDEIRCQPNLAGELAGNEIALELMTELYQQALHAGAIATPQVDSASHLFEYCWAKGIASGRSWFSRRDAKQDANQLRCLMACLEEINRIDGMRLIMSEAHDKKGSVPTLQDQLRAWWKEKVGTPSDTPDAVIAYAFA